MPLFSVWPKPRVFPRPHPPPDSPLSPSPPVTLAALQSYLKAHSITIAQPLAHGLFGVRDPEGNLVFFVQEGAHPASLASPDAPSHRIIHTGFLVKTATPKTASSERSLGFRPYWYGGKHEGRTDWVSIGARRHRLARVHARRWPDPSCTSTASWDSTSLSAPPT